MVFAGPISIGRIGIALPGRIGIALVGRMAIAGRGESGCCGGGRIGIALEGRIALVGRVGMALKGRGEPGCCDCGCKALAGPISSAVRGDCDRCEGRAEPGGLGSGVAFGSTPSIFRISA